MRRVISYVRDNLSADLSVDALAKMASFSPYYFIRLFRKRTGATPGRFVSAVRLRKAAELLDTAKYTAREVSRAVGYTSDSMFNCAFKRLYGQTPGRYGNRMR